MELEVEAIELIVGVGSIIGDSSASFSCDTGLPTLLEVHKVASQISGVHHPVPNSL